MDFLALNIEPGSKALVTVDNWFTAPDGRQYRAVFGTVRGARTAEQTLGIRPNGRSTNWYLEIGNITIAGCQIHFAIRCDVVHLGPTPDWSTHEGVLREYTRPSQIYFADEDRIA